MATKTISYDCQVGGWALPVLFNGDVSGIDPGNEHRINSFIDSCLDLVEGDKNFFWSYDEHEPRFAKCDITGRFDMVYDIQFKIIL